MCLAISAYKKALIQPVDSIYSIYSYVLIGSTLLCHVERTYSFK